MYLRKILIGFSMSRVPPLSLAQWIEQLPSKQWVAGSNPAREAYKKVYDHVNLSSLGNLLLHSLDGILARLPYLRYNYSSGLLATSTVGRAV